jgi:hypothetical protein
MLDIMGLAHLFNIFIKLYGPYMCINGFYTIWEFNREAALLKYLIIDWSIWGMARQAGRRRASGQQATSERTVIYFVTQSLFDGIDWRSFC